MAVAIATNVGASSMAIVELLTSATPRWPSSSRRAGGLTVTPMARSQPAAVAIIRPARQQLGKTCSHAGSPLNVGRARRMLLEELELGSRATEDGLAAGVRWKSFARSKLTDDVAKHDAECGGIRGA